MRDSFYRNSVEEVNNIGMLSIMNLVESGYKIVDVSYDVENKDTIGIIIQYEKDEEKKQYGFR